MAKKILYIAGREAGYTRTYNIVKALQLNNYQLKTILPPDRSFKHYPSLLKQFYKWRNWSDLIIVGFYGQLILPFVWLLSRRPILYDVYISTFDTMVYDRRKASSKSIKGFIYWLSDVLSMKMARMILLETDDHIRDYSKKFHIAASKFRRLFLPVDEKLIFPQKADKKNSNFWVHFHGEYAPFHGAKYIIQAANKLRKKRVKFRIIGTGITYNQDRGLANKLKLNNIDFIERVPYAGLARYMANADVCLGIFGDNPRTLRVLTNKVIEALAVRKPLISAKNVPVQELLEDEKSALLIERASPDALANAILRLKENPELREKIADAGYAVYLKNCTLDIFSKRLKKIIEEMLNV